MDKPATQLRLERVVSGRSAIGANCASALQGIKPTRIVWQLDPAVGVLQRSWNIRIQVFLIKELHAASAHIRRIQNKAAWQFPLNAKRVLQIIRIQQIAVGRGVKGSVCEKFAVPREAAFGNVTVVIFELRFGDDVAALEAMLLKKLS